jgi:hypothetical protein
MRLAWVLVLGTLTSPSVAQHAPSGPFDTISVSSGAVSNVNRTLLHEFWTARTGGFLSVTTPFHVGYLGAGVRYLPYEAKTDVPAFDAAMLYAAWGLEAVFSRVSVRVGLRAGSLRMAFDRSSEKPGIRNESEFTWGGEARLSLELTRILSLYAGYSLERTMTRREMDLQYLSMGISSRFRTPRWLKGFLL